MSIFGPSTQDFKTLNQKLDRIAMKVSDLVDAIEVMRVQLKKANAEIIKKIADLSSSNPDLPPDVLAKLAELKADVQAQDDIVVDAMPEPPAAPPA